MTIMAFSLERYLFIETAAAAGAVNNKMAGTGRALGIIAIIWLVAFLSALPFGLFTSVGHLPYPQEAGRHLVGEPIIESAFCAMLQQPKDFPLFELATCFFFVIPMIFL